MIEVVKLERLEEIVVICADAVDDNARSVTALDIEIISDDEVVATLWRGRDSGRRLSLR